MAKAFGFEPEDCRFDPCVDQKVQHSSLCSTILLFPLSVSFYCALLGTRAILGKSPRVGLIVVCVTLFRSVSTSLLSRAKTDKGDCASAMTSKLMVPCQLVQSLMGKTSLTKDVLSIAPRVRCIIVLFQRTPFWIKTLSLTAAAHSTKSGRR